VYRNLIYTVNFTSDRLLTQARPNPHLNPPPLLGERVLFLALLQAFHQRMLQNAGATWFAVWKLAGSIALKKKKADQTMRQQAGEGVH
jgi:hypothetical protein